MELSDRIESLAKLGTILTDPLNYNSLTDVAAKAHSANNWFTPVNVISSLRAISESYLSKERLTKWVGRYPLSVTTPQKIGVVMAGNIPAVGFHDALCVLISGHHLLAKLSKDDRVLMTFLLDKLIEIEPQWAERITIAERLNAADAYIATGSDNTGRYFEYYFASKPHIIRRNRTSVGILTGDETTDELAALGNDVLQYYGLGCRNVSKVFVPVGYAFDSFYESIESTAEVNKNNHRYFNNYEYNRSVLLVNGEPHVDNGFLMIRESEALVSPISVLFYETYTSVEDLKAKLAAHRDKIQCIVSRGGWFPGSLRFGQAQTPSLADYADGVDTMFFLATLG